MSILIILKIELDKNVKSYPYHEVVFHHEQVKGKKKTAEGLIAEIKANGFFLYEDDDNDDTQILVNPKDIINITILSDSTCA